MVRILQEEETQSKIKEGVKEEKLFAKKHLGKITIDQNISIKAFKEKIFEEYVKNIDDENYKESDISKIRLRNPKNDDLGDIISSKEEAEGDLDSLFLYDDKEILV